MDNQVLRGSVIKRPADSTTSTTSGQTDTMSEQTNTTSRQTSITSERTSTTNGKTSTTSDAIPQLNEYYLICSSVYRELVYLFK